MHDLSLTLLGRVQQLLKSKQQSTSAGQSMYSLFLLPAHQVKIFGRSVLLKIKGGRGGEKKTQTKLTPKTGDLKFTCQM